MRLFSIIHWHHFAYMMISVAMLGYGAAGTLSRCSSAPCWRVSRGLLSAPPRCSALRRRAVSCSPNGSVQSAGDLVGPAQSLRLLAVYRLLCVPFFCAATCICLTFARFAGSRIASTVSTSSGPARDACDPGAVVPGDAGGRAAPDRRARAHRSSGGLAPRWHAARACRGAPLRPHSRLPGRLPQTGRACSHRPTRSLARRCASPARDRRRTLEPAGPITVVENPAIPLRHAPGMSLNATIEPPPQLGVFIDGDGPNALTRYDGRREPLAYLDPHLRASLPPARPAARAGARRRGRRRRAAGDLPWRRAPSMPSSSIRRSSIWCERQFADYSGRTVQRARRARAHGRGARLRRARTRDATTSSRWRCSIRSARRRPVSMR